MNQISETESKTQLKAFFKIRVAMVMFSLHTPETVAMTGHRKHMSEYLNWVSDYLGFET